MIIGIDIDDTISNTYEIQFNLAQRFTIEKLGKSAKIDRNLNFIYDYYCQTFHGWTDEQNKRFWEENYETILNSVRTKYYAKEIIDKLKEDGHKIIIITARFSTPKVDANKVTEKWLEDNRIYYDKLIVGAKEKGKVAKENQIDIFIDDNLENCMAVRKEKIEVYLMDSNTNQRVDKKDIERVYSWPHLYQEIKKYQGGK